MNRAQNLFGKAEQQKSIVTLMKLISLHLVNNLTFNHDIADLNKILCMTNIDVRLLFVSHDPL